MKSCVAVLLALLIAAGGLFAPPRAAAASVSTSNMDLPVSDPGREFMMSCTYGVLAGTLVGAASLAFTNKPGDNLKTVARGASLGLYTGILLGLYVIYIVPSLEEEPEDPVARLDRVPFRLGLTFNDADRPDGLSAGWVLRF